MTAYGGTQGGSNLTSTTAWRISKKRMFTALLQGFPEQKSTALTEFITSAMLYAQLYRCRTCLWCWTVAAPCYICQLTGHQKNISS